MHDRSKMTEAPYGRVPAAPSGEVTEAVFTLRLPRRVKRKKSCIVVHGYEGNVPLPGSECTPTWIRMYPYLDPPYVAISGGVDSEGSCMRDFA